MISHLGRHLLTMVALKAKHAEFEAFRLLTHAELGLWEWLTITGTIMGDCRTCTVRETMVPKSSCNGKLAGIHSRPGASIDAA